MATASFVQFPPLFIDRICFDLKSSGNAFSLIMTIAKEVLQYSFSRASLTRELSCRYLEDKTGIPYNHISEVLKDLQDKNFIQIIEKGKKKVGSIIRLLLTEEELKALPEHREKAIVPKEGTNPESLVPKEGTNRRNLSLEENNNMSVACSSENDKKEEKTKLLENPEKKTPSPECSNEEKLSENLLQAASPAGVHKHTVRNCEKILRKRGITDLASAIKRIGEEMAGRAIKNINGYFTELCKSFDFNPSSSSPATSSDQGAAPPITSATPSGFSRVEYREQKENEEKYPANEKREKSPIAQLKEIEEKYPAEVADIKKKVRIRPSMDTAIIRAALYLAAFRENYPELAIEREKSENGISP